MLWSCRVLEYGMLVDTCYVVRGMWVFTPAASSRAGSSSLTIEKLLCKTARVKRSSYYDLA